MEFIDAYPLYVNDLSFLVTSDAFYRRQVSDIPNPGKLYSDLMDIIVRFAHAGLIHGDYNEFNILIRRETGEPVIIDFPQMVSTSHQNAEWCVRCSCVCNFIERRCQVLQS
jgi:RIO kinase 2